MVAEVVLVVVVGSATLMWWSWERGQRGLDGENREAWNAIATTISGRLISPPGGFQYFRKPRRIKACVDGVDIVVDWFVVYTGRTKTIYTRVVAALDSGAFFLRVDERGVLDGIGANRQDALTGDGDFDKWFRVRASNVAMAHLWLDRDARSAMKRTKAYDFAIKKGWLKVIRRGLDNDVNSVRAAISATAQLAGRATGIAAAWEALAKRLGGVVVEAFAIDRGGVLEIGRDGVIVHVRVTLDGKDAKTRIIAPSSIQVEAPNVEGAAFEQSPQEIALVYPAIVFDAKVLTKGIDIITQLATKRVAPYR